MKRRILLLAVIAAATGCGNGLGSGSEGVGTRYTILLHAFGNPMHVEQSKQWKARTLEDTGWENVFIVHGDDHSDLFWGHYDSVEDAQDNLRRAKEYTTDADVQPYMQALVIPLPGEHVGPPKWDLARAPGTWTVKVAEFYNVPEKDYVGRKDFAVQYCRRLREHGLEAYYSHGPAKSHVYVGAFPKSAVVVTRENDGHQMQIHSPRMKQIMEDFPQLAVNGSGERLRRYDPNTKQVEYVDRRSHPVRVAAPDER